MSGLDKVKRLFKPRGKGGLMREREFCIICETPIDYTSDGAWYNVDISKGYSSWHPLCEVVICEKCVKEEKEKCVRVIMDLLR